MGCIKKYGITDDALIRYQKVNIPGFDKSDYERLLNSSNDEVKYNAICNLILYAPNYAEILTKNSFEKVPPEELSAIKDKIKKAKLVFDTISALLNSPNESIKAASLIFITKFSSNYPNKEELLRLVENVKAKDIRTQYEQLHSLIELSDSKKSIEPDLINGFLNSRSWLIRSMNYLLLGEIPSDNYHKRLVKEYRNTIDEFDKLLIIHAFSKGFDTEVFDLLKEELVTNQNQRIRSQIASIFKMNKDDTAVIKWMISDHMSIDDETLKAILNGYYSELAHSKGKSFFEHLLRSNQERLIALIDEEVFFENLYEGMKNLEELNGFADLKIAVSSVDNLRKSWLAYQDKRNKEEQKREEEAKREEELMENILPKYSVMLEKFLKASEKLFADAGMDQDEIKKATEDIRELLQFIKEDESE